MNAGTSDSVAIRLADAGEVDEILAIETSATRAFLATEHADAPDGPPVDRDFYLRLIAARTVWVAQGRNALVGSAVAEGATDALHLLELAVRLDRQRRGVGRRLVQTVVAAAQARGFAAVTLTTFRGVVFNAPFYEKLGFEVFDAPPRRLRAILDAEIALGLQDRCAMRLDLERGRRL